MDDQKENTSEIKEMLLKIREILEKYLMDTTGEKSFEIALNSLEKDYEVIENSLSTLLNYLALQQNVIRSFRNIEQFTRLPILNKPTDQLLKTLRVIMLPQFEVLISNSATAFKSSERVLLYADNPDIPGGVSDKIREISGFNEKLLELIDYDKETQSSSLGIALNAIIMSRLPKSQELIDNMLNNLNKFLYEK